MSGHTTSDVGRIPIWRRAGEAWCAWAVVGLSVSALVPLLYLLVVGLCPIGFPGDSPPSREHFRAFETRVIPAVLVWIGLVLLCWLDLIRSGRFAWLWAVPWALVGICMIVFMVWEIVSSHGFHFDCFQTGLLGLAGSQTWVAWRAQSLSRKTNTNGGQASA